MRRWMLVTGAAVLATGVFIGAMLLGRYVFGPRIPQVDVSPTPSGSPSPEVPAGFTLFRDDEARFQVAYPEDWERLQSPDPLVRIVATPNGRDSFLIRRIPGEVIPPAVLTNPTGPDAQRFLTRLVRNEGVEILARNPIALAGVGGWFFLYTFQDEESGQEGVHSHYFLFRGSALDVIVFQGLPKERFQDLARTFDQIANSYRPF